MSEVASAAPAAQSSVSEASQAPAETQELSQELPEGEAQVEQQVQPTPAQKKMLKELKIKFNGKEMVEKLPFEIPEDPEAVEYMQRQLQFGKLAQTKAQEAANLQKDITKFVEELRKNPRKVLSDPKWGVDLKKIAAEMIEEEIENSKKSPEQLKAEQLERELKDLKEAKEKEKEEFNQRELERIREEQFERYDNLMTQALSSSELPKSPYTVKKMAEYMVMALDNNIDVTPQDIVPLVKEEMMSDLKEMFAVMPEEVVESIIGKETINKIRKKNLAKAKTARPATPVKKAVQDTGTVKAQPEAPAKKQTIKDFLGI